MCGVLVALLLLAPEPLPLPPECAGIAADHPGDAGLAKDPRVLLVEDFESGGLGQWTEVAGNPAIVAEPHGGKNALRFSARLGETTGGHLWKMLDPGHERVHFRFYVKFPQGHGYVHHFVHLCGYWPATRWPQGHAGERPAGGERFTTGIEPWGDWGKHPAPGAWHFYTYWCEMEKSADGKYWGNGFAPKEPVAVARGRWTCVEFAVRCNTVGKADGEQAFWIDGKAAGRWGGFRWRTDERLKVNGIWLLYYMTPNAARQNRVQDPPPESTVLFDDLVVATDYIGPRAAAR